jgi:hypothetical protein
MIQDNLTAKQNDYAVFLPANTSCQHKASNQ